MANNNLVILPSVLMAYRGHSESGSTPQKVTTGIKEVWRIKANLLPALFKQRPDLALPANELHQMLIQGASFGGDWMAVQKLRGKVHPQPFMTFHEYLTIQHDFLTTTTTFIAYELSSTPRWADMFASAKSHTKREKVYAPQSPLLL